MRQIRIERKVHPRGDPERYGPLPLDPRDPDIIRAKQLLRRMTRVRIPAEQPDLS